MRVHGVVFCRHEHFSIYSLLIYIYLLYLQVRIFELLHSEIIICVNEWAAFTNNYLSALIKGLNFSQQEAQPALFFFFYSTSIMENMQIDFAYIQFFFYLCDDQIAILYCTHQRVLFTIYGKVKYICCVCGYAYFMFKTSKSIFAQVDQNIYILVRGIW